MSRGIRIRFAAWLLAMAALAALFVLRVLPGLKVETDITAMLPTLAADAALEQPLREFADRAGRRVLFLVGADDFARARSAAEGLAIELRAAAAFTRVDLEQRLDPQSADSGYGAQRVLLLSGRHRALLAAGRAGEIAQEALRALYTPAGFTRARPFAEDPLNLYGDFLSQLLPPGRVQPRDGLLTIEDGRRSFILLNAELAASPFAIATQRSVGPVVRGAVARAQAQGAEVIASGVLLHALANGERAAREIGLFGGISTAAVVLVLLLTFRSPRPLLLSLLSLGLGTMCAITAAWLLFERVHLLALVFGSSLVGVGVDYSLHFFSDQFRRHDLASRGLTADATPGAWTGVEALGHVGPAILVGVGTTALGYLSFLLPPFPGLRQMAVLSVAGVGGAALCVLCAYPVLAGRGGARAPRHALAGMRRLAAFRRPRFAWAGLAVLAALVGLGLARLEFQDDVRTLQSSTPGLIAQEARARELLGGGLDSRFFLVQGDSAEQVLQREEALRERLDALVARGALAGYSALSRALPSAQRQAQHEAWLAQQVYAPESGVLTPLFAQLGYEPQAAQRLQQAFEQARGKPLSLDRWLPGEAAAGVRPLWLGAAGSGVAAAVALDGIRDLAALQRAAAGLPGLRFVDRVADISSVLQHYRRIAQWGLGLALVLVGMILAWRYGWRDAPRHLLAPLGACLMTLAILGGLGIPANLFSVLALLLVLGLGVDYTVFLQEGSASRPTTLLAITLAGMTTLLSFGMLAASATPFIRSLGLSVLLGVACTWLLALLASAPSGDNPARDSTPGERT